MSASTLNFETEPIVPSLENFIQQQTRPAFHPNLHDGSGSTLEYLEILFRFFREDFLSALRIAINDFKTKKLRAGDSDGDPNTQKRTNGGYSYQIISMDGDPNGYHTLTFSLENSLIEKRINWSKTDRLKHGSLLALSNDDFDSAWYVTVVHRNENLPKYPKSNWVDVQIHGANHSAIPENNTRNLWAIEPTTFFEAYRPVLERIKFLGRQFLSEKIPVPFESYIVRGNNQVSAPDYLKPGVKLKIDPHNDSTHNSLIRHGIEGLNLDTSQKEAMYLALTREFALIEGPPGTGKTYVGVQVVKVLADRYNKRFWERNKGGTICLMAYTNHAIDHFVLECSHVGVDISNLVRLGGGFCQELKQYSLWSKKDELEKNQQYQQEFQQLRKLRNEEREKSDMIQRLEKSPIIEDYMQFINPSHLKQLKGLTRNKLFHKDVQKWANGANHNIKPMSMAMTRQEAERVLDIFSLDSTHRCKLLAYWLKQARIHAVVAKDRLTVRMDDIKRQIEIVILLKANIVAMTTTGASKFSHLIEAIQPEIVIVEEAAQVIEAHSIAPLTKGCRHLILLGDHWQLKPNISEYVAKEYGLDVSLFERMLNMDLPSVQLDLQYRMHPDIASILVPHIYPILDSHPSVSLYPPVRGLKHRALFICHEGEDTQDTEKQSRCNETEAVFLSSMCKYLIQQGYDQRDITVLSIYSDQVQTIKTVLKTLNINSLRVTTVDAYQGEQNKIILVSFVCSHNTGFLDAHRVSAALSCAKHGFYAMGNFPAYARNPKVGFARRRRAGRVDYTALWSELYDQWQSEGIAFDHLPIQCSNHPYVERRVFTGAQFEEYAPQGGCNQQCLYEYCLHYTCPRLCHTDDCKHERYKCQEMMTIVNSDNQRLMRYCFQLDSYPWNGDEEIEVYFKDCEHTVGVHYTKYKTVTCDTQVSVKLPCGHEKKSTCREKEITRASLCVIVVNVNLPCGHQTLLQCYKQMKPEILTKHSKLCKELTKVTFNPCKHSGEVICNLKKEAKCNQSINLQMGCGHVKHDVICHRKKEAICDEKVRLKLDCGHEKLVACIRQTYPESNICEKWIDKSLVCGHINQVMCRNRNRPESSVCRVVLHKRLDCGHVVVYECRRRAAIESPTYHCQEIVKRTREVCQHTETTSCGDIDQMMARECTNYVKTARNESGCPHNETGECFFVRQKLAGPCQAQVEYGGFVGLGKKSTTCFMYRQKVANGEIKDDKCVIS